LENSLYLPNIAGPFLRFFRGGGFLHSEHPNLLQTVPVFEIKEEKYAQKVKNINRNLSLLTRGG
jgi:hypothetical protein